MQAHGSSWARVLFFYFVLHFSIVSPLHVRECLSFDDTSIRCTTYKEVVGPPTGSHGSRLAACLVAVGGFVTPPPSIHFKQAGVFFPFWTGPRFYRPVSQALGAAFVACWVCTIYKWLYCVPGYFTHRLLASMSGIGLTKKCQKH